MSQGKPRPGQLARYLRQQGELVGSQVFLDGLTAEEALRLSREVPEDATSSRADPGVSGRGAAMGTPISDPGKGEGTPALSSDFETLRQEAMGCQRCALAGSRTHVVFSDGNPGADLMVVGEAPGAQEDKTGKAFVGPAGKLLDLLLAAIDLSREDSVFICNVLKCRPPGNRNPLPAEIQACTPFLRRQIELIGPKAILAVGTFAGQFLTTRESSLGKLRGEVYSYQGVPVVVTYHPAALLRNSGWTRATWDDLQLLRQVMDGA